MQNTFVMHELHGHLVQAPTTDPEFHQEWFVQKLQVDGEVDRLSRAGRGWPTWREGAPKQRATLSRSEVRFREAVEERHGSDHGEDWWTS